MKIRYVTLLAAIAGLMAACGNDRKVEPDPSLKEAASGKFLMGFIRRKTVLILRKRTGWFVLARRTIWLLSGIALSGIHSWHLGSVWTNKEKQ